MRNIVILDPFVYLYRSILILKYEVIILNHLEWGFFENIFGRMLHQVVWESAIDGATVRLWRTSPDGEENYPGDVMVNVTFQLTDDNQVIITYSAVTTGKGTPINLTQHPYFNLAGEVCRLEIIDEEPKLDKIAKK